MSAASNAPTRLGRRQFLLAGTAAGLLAACGGGGGQGGAAGSGAESDLSVARFFGPYYLPGRPARVPIGLADIDGLLPVAQSPATVSIEVRDPSGAVVASGLEATLYSEGLPRPYYAFEFLPEVDGYFDVTVDTGEGTVLTQVQVAPADDPVATGIIGVGDAMPAIVTPTTSDPAGVDPICTRRPPCDLHEHSVADLLGTGAPFALLVATPAFCQTAICGPVLDLVIESLADRDLPTVHAEVYRDPSNNQVPPVTEDYAPVVGDLGLAFEPVLYTIGIDGIVTGRLDYVFGSVEIAALLDAAVV